MCVQAGEQLYPVVCVDWRPVWDLAETHLPSSSMNRLVAQTTSGSGGILLGPFRSPSSHASLRALIESVATLRPVAPSRSENTLMLPDLQNSASITTQFLIAFPSSASMDSERRGMKIRSPIRAFATGVDHSTGPLGRAVERAYAAQLRLSVCQLPLPRTSSLCWTALWAKYHCIAGTNSSRTKLVASTFRYSD